MHLDVHSHAEEDLDRLWETDSAAAAAVVVCLEEMRGDPDLLDKLTTRGDNLFGRQSVNVKQWKAPGRTTNLWRFRILDTPATSHRVVYGYNWHTKQLCVLAVVHKDEFDYDDLGSEIGKRIMADWAAL